MITRGNFKEVLKHLGFEHDLHDSYSLKLQGSKGTISVDFKNENLIYPADVKTHDETTSNFFHNENFVVFECVCRLLKIGYRPEHIELEPRWQIGHNPTGGKADILIRNEKGESYIIIECKTPGGEYNKEKKNTEIDGGQLFSYWQQEASTKWLALYASDYKEEKIVYESHVIHSEDDANILKLAEKDKAVLTYAGATNNRERYNVWKETYHKEWLENILFYPDSQAYKVGIPPLRKKDLKDFTPDDRIVNRFEEILRHNNVSDKENAFNRLIALFICKLVDEIRKQDEDEVEFQYKQGTDTYETLQDKLQRLHHQGMSDFMREEVVYIPSDYAESLFQQYTGRRRKEAIKELNNTIRKLKFYSNNDFSFKDVHNEDLFLQNGKILVEVVQLFQPYRIVYPSRHQFLGDLFEQLLNKGFKQNEGQFFTPMPITRFIWDALPLASYMSHRGLPKVIDYACGAGHFLTEAVEAINAVGKATDNAWTEKHIFGVEKDYRLARVSKISMFMNGAGQSNIIFGDGLENYPDKGIEKGSFDILVANPPYSVKSFKQHLKLKNNQFDLLQSITNDSGEIETLFVERISQLLKPQGIAAVILPASILSNDSSSYIGAREKLLENFYIRAIVALGNKTFSATGTNTVMLFLERYNEPPRMANLIKDSLDDIFNCEDLENFGADKDLLSKYTEHQGISIAEYEHFLSKALEIEELKRHPYLKTYIEAFSRTSQNYSKNSTQEEKEKIYKDRFYKYAIGIERDKLYFFALAYKQRTLVITAPSDNDEQKEFLGYTWSNRKGNEGIVITRPGGKLYNNDDREATETLAYVVRNAFTENVPTVNDDLQKYIRCFQLKDMMNFAKARCTKEIATVAKEVSVISSKFELVKLSDMAQNIEKGKSITQSETIAGEYKVVAGGKSYAYTHNEFNREPNVITLSASGANAGYVNLWKERIFASDCITIYGKNDAETSYLFYYLKSIQNYIYTFKKGAGQPHVYAKDLATIQIPCPPDEVQQKVVEECEAIDKEYNNSRMEIEMYREKINETFANLEKVDMGREKKLKELCNIEGGKRIPKGRGFSNQPTQHPYIRVTDFSRGTINMKELKYIDDEVYKCISRYTISSDDIYLSIAGTIGVVGIIPSELNGANLTENAAKLVIKNKEEVTAKFLVYALQTKSAKEQIDSYTHAVGVPKLALERIREIKVYIPAIDKQNSIVYQVDTYEQAIEKAQAVMDGCATRIQAVLDKYLQP